MKEFNIPIFLLLSILLRVLALGAGLGEALVLIALTSLYGFWIYLESKKQVPVNKDILERIIFIEEKMQLTQDKLNSIVIGSHFKR